MLYTYSQFSFAFAFFFWGWAGYNTMTMTRGMDLGIFSFAGVLLTSSYFLLKKGGCEQNTLLQQRFLMRNIWITTVFLLFWIIYSGKKPTKLARMCSLLSHLLVSANYALGVLYAFNIGPKPLYRFGTYCAIFTVIWLGLAIYSWRLITGVIIQEIMEADEAENLYSFSETSRNRLPTRNYGQLRWNLGWIFLYRSKLKRLFIVINTY